MSNTTDLHLPTWAAAPLRQHFNFSQPAHTASFRQWIYDSAEAFIHEFVAISPDNAPSEGGGLDLMQDMGERAPELFDFGGFPEGKANALVSDPDEAFRLGAIECDRAIADFLLVQEPGPDYDEDEE